MSGIVTHPAPGNNEGTLVNALLHHTNSKLSNILGNNRPGIVHRLDKETSGVMVIAKNDKGDRLLLFVGIIDILQSFGIAKKFEHYAKSLVQDAKSISVNNPSFYRERFIKFMDQNVFPEKMEPREATRHPKSC